MATTLRTRRCTTDAPCFLRNHTCNRATRLPPGLRFLNFAYFCFWNSVRARWVYVFEQVRCATAWVIVLPFVFCVVWVCTCGWAFESRNERVRKQRARMRARRNWEILRHAEASVCETQIYSSSHDIYTHTCKRVRPTGGVGVRLTLTFP